MKRLLVDVSEIQEGDVYGPGDTTVWTAVEDAEELNAHEVSVRVQFADGGLGDRIFDAGHELEIRRPA